MTDDDAPSILIRPLSALRRAHAEASRLGQQRGPSAHGQARAVTYGDRRLRFPLLALTTSQDMGPARHALEQRVVAGFVAVERPAPRIVPPAPRPPPPTPEEKG